MHMLLVVTWAVLGVRAAGDEPAPRTLSAAPGDVASAAATSQSSVSGEGVEAPPSLLPAEADRAAVPGRPALLSGGMPDLSGPLSASVVLRGTLAGEHPGLLLGVRGEWRLATRLSVGAELYSTLLPTLGPRLTAVRARNERSLVAQYGGLSLAYHLDPAELLHAAGRLFVGAGAVGHASGRATDVYAGPALFFMIEPGLVLTLNLTETLAFSGGLGYRLARGGELPGVFSDNDGRQHNVLDGFNLDLAVELLLP